MAKILALVTDCYGGYGGTARYNQDLVETLAAWDRVSGIVVLPRVAPEAFTPPGGKTTQLAAIQGRIRYSLRAMWVALQHKPDIVFCGHLYHSALARHIAGMLGIRLIVQVHGVEAWQALPRQTMRSLAAADTILCVSADTRDCLIRLDPALAATTIVIPNTVGTNFTPGDREKARERFDFGDDFILLSVGRLDGGEPYKGHDRVIRALRSLDTGARRLRYIIAGKGPGRAFLERLSAECGVSALVHFLDEVPEEALPDLYRAADLFALPSTGEGFGIVFIEAMACGTPAIGLDVGGAGDALCDGELGVAVAPDAFPDALDRAVRVSGRQSAEDRLALAARVHAKFGHAAFGAKVKAALVSVLDRHS